MPTPGGGDTSGCQLCFPEPQPLFHRIEVEGALRASGLGLQAHASEDLVKLIETCLALGDGDLESLCPTLELPHAMGYAGCEEMWLAVVQVAAGWRAEEQGGADLRPFLVAFWGPAGSAFRLVPCC